MLAAFGLSVVLATVGVLNLIDFLKEGKALRDDIKREAFIKGHQAIRVSDPQFRDLLARQDARRNTRLATAAAAARGRSAAKQAAAEDALGEKIKKALTKLQIFRTTNLKAHAEKWKETLQERLEAYKDFVDAIRDKNKELVTILGPGGRTSQEQRGLISGGLALPSPSQFLETQSQALSVSPGEKAISDDIKDVSLNILLLGDKINFLANENKGI